MKATANTTIRLGLLNLPVGVCKATGELDDVKFNLGDAQGRKLTQQYVDPDGNVVPANDRTKTINGHIIDSEAIEAIADATKLEGLDILKIESRERYLNNAHRITGLNYIQSHPKNGNANAFKLFVDALTEMDSVAVTKWTARSRQSLMVLVPHEGILLGVTMTFGPDVREPDTQVRSHMAGTYTAAELEMAKQLLTAFSNNNADPLAGETDDAVSMRHDLVAKAMEGKAIEVPAKPAEPAISSLAAALEASLASVAATA